LYVSGIEDEDKFSKMISESLNPYEDPVTDANCKITEEEYKKWSKGIDAIKIPDNVFKVINIIRKKIAVDNDRDDKKDNEEGNAENRGKIAGDNKREDKEENAENRKEIAGDNKREDKKGNMENPIYISDRRWRKIIRLLRASAFLNDRNEVDLMDCFLIQHCIWNEEAEKDKAYQFVRDAIEEHGYTVSFDFESLNQELDEFKKEIDEETKFVKDTRVPVLKKIYDDYYEMEGMPTNCNLIKQSDFNSLTDDNVSKYLYYWHNNYKRVEQYNNNSYHSLGHGSSFDLRKGNAEFSVFVDDTEYQLKMVVQGDKRQNTKKPHPSVEKDWDERVTQYLQKTAEWLEQIEAYRNKDLEHLRTNIFVKPELANIVESHIDATKKDIEKIKVTIREIQNGYKKLKDEEVVIDDDK
jgi:MoxR-like ATPase